MDRTENKTAYFDRFSLDLKMGDALDVSTPGQSADGVAADLASRRYIALQLDDIGATALSEELAEYGNWETGGGKTYRITHCDDNDNRQRIVWIAGGNIREEQNE